jgi:hypothetical protein
MSIWDNMGWIPKILFVCGFILIAWAYVGIIRKKVPLTPIDHMSIGLGFIGIALALTTMQ